MIGVVLDANVLAPGFLNRGSASGELINLWQREVYELVVSEHLLAELTRTYTDPYFQRRIESGEVALITDLTVSFTGAATQPKDDLVLSTALSGKASLLGTRDRQLLKLGAFQEVRIASPGQLLEELRRRSDL
jgi:putative PIN family toxin of toxin-antitoxin system